MGEVEVVVYTDCPKHIETTLDQVRGAFIAEGNLPGKLKGDIWKRKTIGIMNVQFAKGEPLTIAAISGCGVREWTGSEVRFNNQTFEKVQDHLEKLDQPIIWANLTYEHSQYQRLQGEPIRDQDREEFAKEYEKRIRRKVDNLKDAKLSRPQLYEKLKRSAVWRPDAKDEDQELLVDFYYRLDQDPEFADSVITQLRELIAMKPGYWQEWAYEHIVSISIRDQYSTFLEIEQRMLDADPPPSSAQDVVDRFCKPFDIPVAVLSLYAIALGWKDPPDSSRMADMTVQCAEDNALYCLNLKRNSRRVTRIEWFAANVSRTSFRCKSLCAFCAVSFVPRAKQINSFVQ